MTDNIEYIEVSEYETLEYQVEHVEENTTHGGLTIGTRLGDDFVLINAAGRTVCDASEKHAGEMKESFKIFLKHHSSKVNFDRLVKIFANKTRKHENPIYVLSHDHKPKGIIRTHRYAVVCAAPNCENAYYREGYNWKVTQQSKNFFGFPPNPRRCSEWIDCIGRPKYHEKTIDDMDDYRICEDHFRPEDFTNEHREDLLDSAVPSLLLNNTDYDSNDFSEDSDLN